MPSPSADWNWGMQRDFFREQFGEPADSPSPEWPRDQYDPRPAQGAAQAQELVLPMPCGGAMVFRRIEVGGDRGWLGEREIALGSADEADAPFDGRHLAYLSGGFSSTAPGSAAGRHYYLGKYEVTQLQYGVFDEPCPARRAGRRPAVEVSWYDAVEFTRRYTRWLHQNAPDRLPQEDGTRGYLRLPTEAEWEYAARGGLAVDGAAFQAAVFPTGGDSIDDFAWMRESVASSFEPRPVGALSPNPLGLYDILGNASELVFDLFRLSGRGRLHGQPGGFLVKGGHFRTSRASMRSSWRQEHPHFSPVTGMANRLDTVGFRVAIAAPVLTSQRRVEAVLEQWRRRPPDSAPLADLESWHSLAAEVRSSLADMQASLEECLAGRAPPSLPVTPVQPAEPTSALRTWSQVRDSLRAMAPEQIRERGLESSRGNDPATALALFQQAVARGDGWSALVIGAMYDPLVAAAEAPAPALKWLGKPSVAAALCWYRRAQELGEPRAVARLELLETLGMDAAPNTLPVPAPTPADCTRLMREAGIP